MSGPSVPSAALGKHRLLACAAGVVAAVVGALGFAQQAQAQAWVSRPITIPSRTAALDVGFAVARWREGGRVRNGPGMNLELAFGLSSTVELGLRTGFRFTDVAERARADEFARIFDTQTYGSPGTSPIANPEVKLRFALVRTPVLQLAFDTRIYLPLVEGARFGFMAAMPLWLRVGSVRLDTGLYVPVIFTEPRTTIVSVPLAVWVQVSHTTWLGPEIQIRHEDYGSVSYRTYPFAFGLGTAIGPDSDLRLRIFFRDIDGPRPSEDFGVGLAFQFRS
jgi:hypothetical protein